MQAVLRVDGLAGLEPIEAAALFYRDFLAGARELLEGDASSLVIVLPHAPLDHDDWRRALARDLARAHAPKRVNCVAGPGEEAIAAMLTYLEDAPGITGQYCPAHD